MAKKKSEKDSEMDRLVRFDWETFLEVARQNSRSMRELSILIRRNPGYLRTKRSRNQGLYLKDARLLALILKTYPEKFILPDEPEPAEKPKSESMFLPSEEVENRRPDMELNQASYDEFHKQFLEPCLASLQSIRFLLETLIAQNEQPEDVSFVGLYTNTAKALQLLLNFTAKTGKCRKDRFFESISLAGIDPKYADEAINVGKYKVITEGYGEATSSWIVREDISVVQGGQNHAS